MNRSHNILEGTRSYLSGPMDFVGSRVVEKYLGWRAILSPILRALRVTVLDPWNKPAIRGLSGEYGQEGVLPSKAHYESDFWTNPATRARFEKDFWETVHIDCRMTDVSDFLISFVPTNIYSVGTVHEIVLARSQFKPVLFVSPPVKYEYFPELDALDPHVKELLRFYGLKENPEGIPSQWYGNIVGGHNMFDGFGWEGLEFKAPDFYSTLIHEVLELAKPSSPNPQEERIWNEVRQWARDYPGFRSLQGGLFDQIQTGDEERHLLEQELLTPREQERKFFWYNRPYRPRRPMLYQLFAIASGHIPPRTNVVNTIGQDGTVDRVTYDAVDDDWLLISTDSDHGE